MPRFADQVKLRRIMGSLAVVAYNENITGQDGRK